MGIRGWRCLVVGRLRGQEFERLGFRVIEKLRGLRLMVIKKLRDWNVGAS